MTNNYTLTLAVMLTVGIATALSRRVSYSSSIYTEKLLRRGLAWALTDSNRRPARCKRAALTT
jgi:H+/Cl- antiporter ClcA